MKRATILATAALSMSLPPQAIADDHPYAGVWGEAGAREFKSDPQFYGRRSCYSKFTEQSADGRFRYYLVNHAKWVEERKIEYLLAQEGRCEVRPGGKSEKCAGLVIGEKESEWFITYKDVSPDAIKATFYENTFYFDKGFNGQSIVRHKCPFDIATVKKYISGRTIADCAERCRAFGRTEAAQLADMISFAESNPGK